MKCIKTEQAKIKSKNEYTKVNGKSKKQKNNKNQWKRDKQSRKKERKKNKWLVTSNNFFLSKYGMPGLTIMPRDGLEVA